MTKKTKLPAYLNAGAETMGDDATALQQVLTAYDRAWEDLNVEAILAHYHYPCMLLTPAGVLVRDSEEELRPSITSTVEDMKSADYGGSEITEVSSKQLSDSIALVSQYAVRFDSAGNRIGEGVTTYTFTKADGSWKIAVLAPHHPRAMPRYV